MVQKRALFNHADLTSETSPNNTLGVKLYKNQTKVQRNPLPTTQAMGTYVEHVRRLESADCQIWEAKISAFHF